MARDFVRRSGKRDRAWHVGPGLSTVDFGLVRAGAVGLVKAVAMSVALDSRCVWVSGQRLSPG